MSPVEHHEAGIPSQQPGDWNIGEFCSAVTNIKTFLESLPHGRALPCLRGAEFVSPQWEHVSAAADHCGPHLSGKDAHSVRIALHSSMTWKVVLSGHPKSSCWGVCKEQTRKVLMSCWDEVRGNRREHCQIRGWWVTSTGCPEKLWLCHPWNYSRLGWTEVTWSSRKLPCPWHGVGWNNL